VILYLVLYSERPLLVIPHSHGVEFLTERASEVQTFLAYIKIDTACFSCRMLGEALTDPVTSSRGLVAANLAGP
jgi:hypothetical protein